MKRTACLIVLAVGLVGLVGCSSPAVRHPDAKPVKVPETVAAPDGKIVFREFLDSIQTIGALFVINSDGTGKTQITHPARNEIDEIPDWSPDGSHIVFTRLSHQGTAIESHQVVVIDSDGSHPHVLTEGNPSTSKLNFNDQAAFSPDGKLLAYTHGSGSSSEDQLKTTGLWVMSVDGRHAHQIVALPPYSGDVGGPAWSPDGKELVYGVFNANTGEHPNARAFFLVNTDGTHKHQLTPWDSASDGIPDWSVAANRIVFRVAPDEQNGVGNFFSIRPDGSGLTQLTHFKGTIMSHKVSYSPDGGWIVYSKANTDGVNHLTISRVDGSQTRVIDSGDLSTSSPDWSPVT